MEQIERITRDGSLRAVIIRATASTDETTFLTPPDASFQAGFVVYPRGGAVIPHEHLPVIREIVGTSEFLVVRQGRCVLDLYDDDRKLITSRELLPGDCVLSLAGGHGFRMVEDTVLFEIKQGPYGGQTEKRRFDVGDGDTA